MILTIAVFAGLVTGLVWTWLNSSPYQPPNLKYMWMVFVAFLPQYFLLYLPGASRNASDVLVAILLTASQIGLIAFAWLNRDLPGMRILLIGAALNLTVMAANRGFMPISPQTASRLVSQDVVDGIPIRSRFGAKDILLTPEQTRLEWLADRYLPPAWSPYQVAFSLGDVFLAFGVFWVLASQKLPTPTLQPERMTS